MKKLFLVITMLTFVMFSLAPVQAATRSTNNVAAGAHTIITNSSVVLDSITLFTTNATPTLVYLYDGALLSTNAAWTNYTSYVTNLVYSYVTSLGTTNTGTNSVLYVQANPHAAATINVEPLVSLVVPANGDLVTYTPPTPLVFSKSLVLSNSLIGVSGTISYRTQ